MPAIFVHENQDPIQFYLHRSVEDDQRNELTRLIQKYGGAVLETDEGADTVIVDPDYPKAYDLQNAYYVHQQERYRRIRVEDTTFVCACIQARTFQNTPVIRYPMRGNHPGRVNFTKEDEKNFCRYMAIKIPDIGSGGRLGHRIYQDLVYVMPQEYRWVTRHPAESWREHYRNKNNKARLDAMIEQFRNEEQPREEQLYIYDRKLNAGRFRNVDEEDSPTDNEPETYDSYWSRRQAREKSRSRRPRKAVAQEEEESSSNEEPSGDEDGAPERHRPSSLFSVDEYEEEQIDNTQHVSRMLNEPAPSQATLVGNELGVRWPPNRARKPRDQQVVPTEGPVANEREESVEPEPPIPPVASTSSQGKRKRGEKVQVPTDNAPYRNTRSISDSMRRPTAKSMAIPRPAKKGRKKKPMEATQNEESTAEEDQGLPEVPPLVPGTTTEEGDVEQLLMSESNVEGPRTPGEEAEIREEDPSKRRRLFIASSSEEEEEEEDHQAPSGRSPLGEVQLSTTRHSQAQSLDSEVEQVEETLRGQSLDTDDEQIDRELSRPQSRRTGSEYDEMDPLELIKEFNESTELQPGVSPSPVASPNTRDRWLSSPAGDEQWRESSVESFPKQGTRASAIKKQVEEKRKMEEYVPPPTSRAARYTLRQQRR
ncbi:hypothetical protein F5887DRAFT_913513 [Amanita rubescens]|nr:hypothetical protein F5887DRAFT_913513 [Amanita rubescens]